MQQADPRLQHIYNTHYIKREKEFIELLFVISEKSIEEVITAIETLKKVSPLDISTEKIKAIINRNSDDISMNYVDNDTSGIIEKSRDMLNKFKNLIPMSSEEFNKEVAVI